MEYKEFFSTRITSPRKSLIFISAFLIILSILLLLLKFINIYNAWAPELLKEHRKMSTCWRRVKYNNDIVDDYPWELKFIEGKGYSAFATRNFSAGDWICSEFPTVWISGHHPFSETQMNEIESKIEKLDDHDRFEFYKMENVFRTEEDLVHGMRLYACRYRKLTI